LLSSFADQASLAIERDRLLRDAREQAARAQALARLNQVVSSSLDVGHVLHAIACAAAELMAAPLVSFWVADEARRHLDLRALSDDRLDAEYPVRSLPFDYSIAGWVATRERPLDVPDISSDLIVAGKDWFLSHGFTSAYGTPIMSQNSLLGVLVLFGSKPFRVTDANRELLDAFVTQAAGAIRNARLYDETRIAEDRLARRSAQLDLLNQMGSLLQACVSEHEAYAVVEQFLSQFFPDASGGVFVTSASRNMVEARATFGAMPSSPEAAVFKPDECWALRRGRMHVVETTVHGLQCSHVPHPAPGSYVCLPLIAQGDSLGVLYIGAGIGHTWSESQQRLATTVADHVGLAVANLKLRETLRRQSIRDPLTGLFNRRYLEETIERELRRTERSGGTLGVIMLDLDHFKRFNDSFGHGVADTVLREFSALLQSSVRASDIVCRYGGEEFLLVMPDTSAETTFELAEQLRAAVKQLTVSHHGQMVGSVTVSGGVAVYPTHAATAEALIHSADAALYRAKGQGRDQIAMSA
jgi:diguanylate cyclase (GGDEF)-like protein